MSIPTHYDTSPGGLRVPLYLTLTVCEQVDPVVTTGSGSEYQTHTLAAVYQSRSGGLPSSFTRRHWHTLPAGQPCPNGCRLLADD